MKEKLEAKLKSIEETFNKQMEEIKTTEENLGKMKNNIVQLQGAYQATKELLDEVTPKVEEPKDAE